MEWHLYILDCDGRYYTGISTDPGRRLLEHRAGKSRGARFTRTAQSHALVYSISMGDRSTALRAEARVKKLRRAEKERLVMIAPGQEELLEMLRMTTGTGAGG